MKILIKNLFEKFIILKNSEEKHEWDEGTFIVSRLLLFSAKSFSRVMELITYVNLFYFFLIVPLNFDLALRKS